MNPEMTLSEISQFQKDKCIIPRHEETIRVKPTETEGQWWLQGMRGRDEVDVLFLSY